MCVGGGADPSVALVILGFHHSLRHVVTPPEARTLGPLCAHISTWVQWPQSDNLMEKVSARFRETERSFPAPLISAHTSGRLVF